MIEDCRAGVALRTEQALRQLLAGLPASLPPCKRDVDRIATLSSRHQAMEMMRTLEESFGGEGGSHSHINEESRVHLP